MLAIARALPEILLVVTAPADLADELQLRRAEDFTYCAMHGSEHVAIEGVDDQREVCTHTQSGA